MCSTFHLFSLPNDVALALFWSLTSSLVFLVYQIFPISIHSVVFLITKKPKQINEHLFLYYPSVIPFISFLYNRNPQRNCLYSLSSFTVFVLLAQCLQWTEWYNHKCVCLFHILVGAGWLALLSGSPPQGDPGSQSVGSSAMTPLSSTFSLQSGHKVKSRSRGTEEFWGRTAQSWHISFCSHSCLWNMGPRAQT